MTGFSLKIVSPQGVQFDGTAQKVVVRTTSGDVAIMARHIHYVAPLGMGEAAITAENATRYAACIGGMVSVMDGAVTLVPMTFEWADAIDVPRAEASRQRAQAVLDNKDSTDREILQAKARLKRALVRKSTAGHNQ